MPATPYLTIDLDVLERNLASMQDFCTANGVALRPHAKTHKLAEIARRQVDLGSSGLTVATLGEAEAFADAGVDDLFVAYPIVAGDPNRVRALAERVRLTIGLDSTFGVEHLRGIAGLHVLIEVDCGLHRTGVTPAQAGELAASATDAGLRVDGVFAFPGQSYLPAAAAAAALDEARALTAAAQAFARHGLACPVRSGGSTPSARSSDTTVVTELRPGVYALNDAQQVALGRATLADVAVGIVTTVISRPRPDYFVLDAGSKTIAADRPSYAHGHGLLPAWPDALLDRIWEHHGVVDAGAETERPAIGERVMLVPNHVCTAMNLTDSVFATRKGEIVDEWRLIARGRND